MILKKTKREITCYRAKGGFTAEVTEEDGMVSFWLGHEDCDIRERMFALPLDMAPEARWTELLENNLEEYMADFTEAWLED